MDPKYPNGKIDDSDDGAIMVRVYCARNRVVVVEYADLVKWIAMSRAEALAFADSIVSAASQLPDDPAINTAAPKDVQ